VFSPDGKRIVSASSDHALKVWDAGTGQETMTLEGHTTSVYGVGFSPDGERIVSGSGDGIKVWDAANGQEIMEFEGKAERVAFSPDSRWIAAGDSGCNVNLWNTATGHQVATLKGHTGGVTGVAFSPDGSRIVPAAR
jgi:WD40 repeat protein